MTGPLCLYESRLNDATPVASSTAAATATVTYNVLNLRDARPYSFWKPNAMPGTVTVDCGSAKTADYLLVYSHDLFTKGCTIEIRKSTDNFAANDVLVATSTPADNLPLLLLFTSTSSRYWRITVKTGTAPTLAIVMFGNRLEVPAAPREGFDPVGRNSVGQNNRAVKGYPLGRVIAYQEFRETLNYELLSWTWVRDSWGAAWTAWLQSEPWLYAWNPDTYPKETWLVLSDGSYNTPHKSGSYADLQVPVTGVFP